MAALGSPWPSCKALSRTVLCPPWAFLHGRSLCVGSRIPVRKAPLLPGSQLKRLPESFSSPVCYSYIPLALRAPGDQGPRLGVKVCSGPRTAGGKKQVLGEYRGTNCHTSFTSVFRPVTVRPKGSGHSTQHPSFPRAACEQQAVTFTLQEDRASLTLSGGASALDFDLHKVPAPEAASRLQALTLRLADQVCTLKRQLEAVQVTGASPRKNPCLVGPQLFLPDPDPQRGGPGLGTRRRCPGESLINPGFKSKKPAGGVDFESP
uniref:PAXX non-homologous end joining factor n=1 Tax=Ursus maritimus TaxID=29073 RepID=A0A452VF00_URSMA